MEGEEEEDEEDDLELSSQRGLDCSSDIEFEKELQTFKERLDAMTYSCKLIYVTYLIIHRSSERRRNEQQQQGAEAVATCPAKEKASA